MADGKPSPIHRIIVDKRQAAEITGVQEVGSFDEKEILLLTEEGKISVKGEKLHISQMDLESGCIRFTGKVNGILYLSDIATSKKEPLLKRLFR